MTWQNAALAISEGLAGASGDEATAARAQADIERNRQAHQDYLKVQMAPLLQSIAADQQRLSALPEGSPDRDAVLNNMALTIGKVRNLHGDKTPAEDPSRLASTINGIRQHLRLGGKTQEQLAADQSAKVDKFYQQNRQQAGEYANAALPFSETVEGQKIAEQEKLRQLAAKADWQNFKGPSGDVVSVDVAHQTPPPGYVKVGTQPAQKAKKGLKLLGSETMPYGVLDQDTGQQYLADQLGPNGTASAEAKQIWQTVQQEITAKQAAADAKDRERDRRFLESQAAIADRMGRSEEWQAMMADYREQLGVYKTLDTQANKTQVLADTYEAQYQDPIINKSAVDTALLTDYTSVLAQGGKKTQAEISLARNIGSFKLNWEQKLKKATTGELPAELRKMYLDYIKAAAKSQREDADKVKPPLPDAGGPRGPVHQKNRTAQKQTNVPDVIVVTAQDMAGVH